MQRRQSRRPVWLVALLFVLLVAPSARADECTPSFPYSGGWLGGDAAYSIPLGDRRSLWLFGDSFVGAKEQKNRAGSTMVSNTIAISTCRGATWRIDYHWNNQGNGRRARAFFDSGTEAFRYWPLDGFIFGGKLYLALMRVTKTAAGGPFGFRIVGVDLAMIENPDAEPASWSIRYLELARSDVAFPGAEIVVQPPYAWFFGVLDDAAHQKHSVFLSRISLDRLDSPAQSIEYLARDGAWENRHVWQDLRIIVDDGAPEFSVRFHRAIGKWILTQQQPGSSTSQIGIRTSDHLDGPWSPFRPLMTEPEMRPPRAEVFCYAAKEHPEFESPSSRTVLVTYACNSLNFGNLVGDMSLYRPVSVRLRLP